MKEYVLLTFIFFCSCSTCDNIDLLPYCPENSACYTDQNNNILLGEQIPDEAYKGTCSIGLLKCKDEKQTCVGLNKPTIEVCDNKDNDCDNVIDNGNLWLSVEDPDNDCNGYYCGRCFIANKICSNGVWQCIPIYQSQPEICNNLDDDCNCKIDDNIETIFYYPEYEYPHTVGIGECRPGIKTCYDGNFTNIPPILPKEEICDGLDNNCNGFIDDDSTNDPKAFFIVLDISGSMNDNIVAIKTAICDFAQADISQNSLFAIVEVSINYNAPYVFLAQDFSNSQQICDLMNSSNFGIENTLGAEYMLQGILLSSSIVWPENMERKVLAFTDEEIQHYLITDQQDVLNQCFNENYEVGIYSISTYINQWDTIIDTCGGFEELLTNDIQEMKQSLISHYFGVCQ